MQLAGAVKVVVRGPTLDILGRLSLHLAFALTMLLNESNIGSFRDVGSVTKLRACELDDVVGAEGWEESRELVFFQFDGGNYPSKQQDCIFRVAATPT